MDSPRTPKSTSLSAELKELIDKRNMLTTRTRMKVLSALDEIDRQNTPTKENSLRAQTIQEILSSEIKYLQQLEIIKEFFMKPILERKLLNNLSYTTLFENIETLYNVNGELLKELKQNPDNVAPAFRKLAPFFKLYSVYAYNYKRALILLQEIQQNDPIASEFISNQETRPEVNCKLASLLITPIQRVPRYKLLLKELLRHTQPRKQEYNELQVSLVEIDKVASHINDLVAEYEDTQKLLELQKHIAGSINLIKPGRKLIRQGPLMRVSRRGNSSFRRHFVLLSDTLLYCKGNPDSSLTVCCLLPLNKCKIERVLSNGLFKVVCLQESLLLYSENGDSEAWIEELQQAVNKYVECRKTLRKDSSSRIPMRKRIHLESEDIIERRANKRKRPISSSDPAAEENTSNIIYVDRDTEPENSSESSNFFNAFKRFKRNSNEVDSSVNERIKSWMDGMKRKSSSQIENHCESNFFHQTKNNKIKLKNESEISNYKTESIQNNKKNCNFNEPDFKESANNENILSLKNVNKIFVSIGNSLKDFFYRN